MLSPLKSFFGMISAFFHRRKLDSRLQDELQMHIDMLAEKNMRLGMTSDEARRQARIAVGGFDQARETVCDARGIRWLHELDRNFRYASRIAWKQKALSLTVIGLIAVACGANVAIFSYYNSLFLRPLPFPNAERLIDLDETAPKWNQEYAYIDYTDFHEWRKENQSLDVMGLYWYRDRYYSRKGNTGHIITMAITHDFPAVFQMQPVMGRGFSKEEDRPEGPKVAILGYRFWQREFAGSRLVLGEEIKLDGETYTVIGVYPNNEDYPAKVDVWTPLQMSPSNSSRAYFLRGTGLLKKGITLEQSRADIARIHKNMIDLRPVNSITSPRLQFLREREYGFYRKGMIMFQTAVGILLLIVCANIAGMMLARAESRSREMGIRTAIGSSRAGIVRQLLTESFLLSIPGVFIGLLFGNLLLKLSILWIGELPTWAKLTTDIRVIVFCGLLMGAATLFFGLTPAFQAARVNVHHTLHETNVRSSAGGAKRRGLNMLVIGEIALAFVLLIGAGLLLRTWKKAQAVDPGLQVNHVLTFMIDLPQSVYKQPADWERFYDQFLIRCRRLPGVQSVSGAMPLPIGGGMSPQYFEIEGAPLRSAGESAPLIPMRVIFPDYFRTMGIPLISGHAFTREEGRAKASVMVNESFVRRFWSNANPINKRIRYNDGAYTGPWLTVVGVSRDNKEFYGLDRETPPAVYYSYDHSPNNAMYVLIRSDMDTAGLFRTVRNQLHEMDPDLPLLSPMTMTEAVNQSLSGRRFLSVVMGIFAGTALLITAAGIYGVVNYSVSRRTHEIGIRMALGATRSQVLSMVVGGGMRLVIAGAVFGIVGAVAASQFMRVMLFDVTFLDARTYAVVGLLLIGVVAAASLLPARRAASIDPVRALRSE